jgi:hypothetical protein
MKVVLIELRILLAVIVLIAAGAVAGIGDHGMAAAAGFGVAAETTAHSLTGSGSTTIEVVTAGQHDRHDGCGCRPDCAHAAGSGCCAAGLSIAPAGECRIFTPLAARLVVVTAFLATGIEPEALLRPPQILA